MLVSYRESLEVEDVPYGVRVIQIALAVHGVLSFLLRTKVPLASTFAVRDEKADALITAVGDGRGAAAGQRQAR